MNEVTKTDTTPIEIALGIDEDGKTTARRLYEFLELAKGQFSRWAKTNITENPFSENGVDYEGFDIDVEGNKTVDYRLSANFAKKLSMQGKTEKAEQARNYFIKIENKLKEIITKNEVTKNISNKNFNMLHTLNYKGTLVITTAELAKYYYTGHQNILSSFYANQGHFKEGIHYFLLKINEEMDFRTINELSIKRKLYLWTSKSLPLFTKIVNSSVAWKQYNKMLDIVHNKVENPKEIATNNMQQLPENRKQFPIQNKWYLKNSYKIERICKALDIEKREFLHIVLTKIQEKYDMEVIKNAYGKVSVKTTDYATGIIDCLPELSELADDILLEYMLSIVDKFALLKSMTVGKM